MSDPWCGASWTADVGNEHWVVVCIQDPDHNGPHVGMMSWPQVEPEVQK